MDVFMPDLSRYWLSKETSSPSESARREEPSVEAKARTQSDYAQLCERVSAARFVA